MSTDEISALCCLLYTSAGDTVELVSMGTRASVLSVNKDGTLQLQAGILKITAKQDEVRVVEGETQSQKEARRIVQRAQHTLRAAAALSLIHIWCWGSFFPADRTGG